MAAAGNPNITDQLLKGVKLCMQAATGFPHAAAY